MKFKYFSEKTDPRLFFCQETGESGIPDAFIHRLDSLRGRCGFPFIITSGYRSPRHSIEAAKDSPGEHTRAAADIAISGGLLRYKLVNVALEMGFSGIGIADSYIHLDDRDIPAMWTY